MFVPEYSELKFTLLRLATNKNTSGVTSSSWLYVTWDLHSRFHLWLNFQLQKWYTCWWTRSRISYLVMSSIILIFVMGSICPSIYPSTFRCFPKARLCEQQFKQKSPDLLLHKIILQFCCRTDMVPWVQSILEDLLPVQHTSSGKPPRSIWKRLLSQLASLDVERKRLCSELLLVDCCPHSISEGMLGYSVGESHFVPMYPEPCSVMTQTPWPQVRIGTRLTNKSRVQLFLH